MANIQTVCRTCGREIRFLRCKCPDKTIEIEYSLCEHCDDHGESPDA